MVPLQAQNAVHPLLRLVGPFVVALVVFTVVYGLGRLLVPRLVTAVARRRGVDDAIVSLLVDLARVVAAVVAGLLAFGVAGFGALSSLPLLVTTVGVATGYVLQRHQLATHGRPTTDDLTVALLALAVTLLALGVIQLSVGGALVSLLVGTVAGVVVGSLFAVVDGLFAGGSTSSAAVADRE
ncbi:hypothetical protein SAMN04487948_12446 [Halogranum amylolyticum]|uniref:Mechanosensitive ion channel n=1 Tax=Halogranum amylolyticum TaxID=660520 RepID=A0A1H8W6N4_9EURY|nr:hypothetical protein [Halogranum amylolyticum]SEP23280.1 hypothetical protein SAMN04487948_12446 [Halogranum amylolyticum]